MQSQEDCSQICRRVDEHHRSLGQLLSEEVFAKLGVEFYIGLPAELENRVSFQKGERPDIMMQALSGSIPASDERYNLQPFEKAAFLRMLKEPSSLTSRALLQGIKFSGETDLGNCRYIRQAELPSSNGMTNVLAMATLGSLCATRGQSKKGVFLNQPEIFHQLERRDLKYSEDLVTGWSCAYTQGGLGSFEHNGFGWGGAGGNMIRYFPSSGLSVAYCTNRSGVRQAHLDPTGRVIECNTEMLGMKKVSF